MLVATTLHQRSDLAEQLGAGFDEPGPAVIDAMPDPGQHTSVPGLSAAGDAASQMPSVAVAIAAGSTAAAARAQPDRGGPQPRRVSCLRRGLARSLLDEIDDLAAELDRLVVERRQG